MSPKNQVSFTELYIESYSSNYDLRKNENSKFSLRNLVAEFVKNLYRKTNNS